MPSLAKRNLKQRCVYWELDEYNNYGDVKVKAPVEICCRWEEVQTEVIGDEGSPIAVDGTVCVDRALSKGGILRLGCLKDTPTTVTDGLMEIITTEETPDIKGRVFVRSVTIRRYRQSLPTVAS